MVLKTFEAKLLIAMVEKLTRIDNINRHKPIGLAA